MKFLRFIEPHFLAHFLDTDKQDLNGFTFADMMHRLFISGGQVSNDGTRLYVQIKTQGGTPEASASIFSKLIQSYPPIMKYIYNPETGADLRGRYLKFLEEFFGYDEASKAATA
jgi:hypothetical protein